MKRKSSLINYDAKTVKLKTGKFEEGKEGNSKSILLPGLKFIHSIRKIHNPEEVDKAMIDLGAGNGSVLDYFLQEGFEVYGIERSEKIYQLIPEHIKERVYLADLNKNLECWLKYCRYSSLILFSNKLFDDTSSQIIENNIVVVSKVGTIIVTTKSSFIGTKFNQSIQKLNNFKVNCGKNEDYTEWNNPEFYFYKVFNRSNPLIHIQHGQGKFRESISSEKYEELVTFHLEYRLNETTKWPTNILKISVNQRKEIINILDQMFNTDLTQAYYKLH